MSDNRQKLINMMQGKPAEFYAIDYSVDIKRNITIWRGAALKPSSIQLDWFFRIPCEIGEHSHFLPAYRKLYDMENEVAATLTREEIVNAFLDFRKTHPRDGWGGGLVFCIPEDCADCFKGYEEGMQYDRDDEKQVNEELIKRNRDYIKELWGVDLSGYPLDWDFADDWERRCDALHRQFGWDRKLTDEEIWGRKVSVLTAQQAGT